MNVAIQEMQHMKKHITTFALVSLVFILSRHVARTSNNPSTKSNCDNNYGAYSYIRP